MIARLSRCLINNKTLNEYIGLNFKPITFKRKLKNHRKRFYQNSIRLSGMTYLQYRRNRVQRSLVFLQTQKNEAREYCYDSKHRSRICDRDKVERIRKRTGKRNERMKKDLSHLVRVRRGPPTLSLSFIYEQATKTCFSTGRPHHLPSSNPGSTGPLLLPRKPRYFVVVSSSMPYRFSYLAPFLYVALTLLSLSSTLQLCHDFTLALFPLYRVCIAIQFFNDFV